MVKLSLVFGFKNRDSLRVRRCLDSLVTQELDNFEVIFVDYGSEPECREEVEIIVKSYSFTRYVYCAMRGRPWNRSHALNIGVVLAQSELVITTDIDLIFSEFSLKKMIEGYDGKSALHATCYYLPESFGKWDKLSNHKSEYGLPCKDALGLLMLLPKSTLLKLGGFDEFYKFWGAEDEDIECRLHKLGFETKFLDINDFPLYHQWHPVHNYVTFSFMPLGYWSRVQFHFGQYAHAVKRNESTGMGSLIAQRERPALLFLDGVIRPHKKLFVSNSLDRELAAEFFSLADGEAIEIETDWSKPSALVVNMATRLNRILRRFHIHIDYSRNTAKETFWSFIDRYPELIRDFAYASDEHKFYLVRGE
jgi:glycosyltransferase involved in cell wall biosynthesis